MLLHARLLLALAAALPWLAPARPVVRDATPSDIEANWNLVELSGADESACPATITHTSWTKLSSSAVSLPHNTILVNRVRCDGLPTEPAFLMYLSTEYSDELNPLGDADPLPQRMRQLLTTTGPNVAARAALLATGEQFLMGYESHQRFCKGAVFFANGTTSYLFRPFASFSVPNISTQFVPGTKYLLMIPLFKATTCVYSARLRVAVEVPTTILPPETPQPSDEELFSEPSPQPQPDSPQDTSDTADDDAAATEESDGDGGGDGDSDSDGDDDDDDDDDDDVCFPASATVSLRDGSVVRMCDLKLGDQVLVSNRTYSSVFAFSHRDRHARRTFYTLRTASANAISATRGHFIYADRQLVPIETVSVGQMLHTVAGWSAVTSVSTGRMRGLYNPQTEHGDIVVNGVVASTYTASLAPSVAHAALAPLRAVSNVCGADVLAALIHSGIKNLPGRSWVRAA